jgi:hypothetical protein
MNYPKEQIERLERAKIFKVEGSTRVRVQDLEDVIAWAKDNYYPEELPMVDAWNG